MSNDLGEEKRKTWCRGPESNWLRPPFQGGALPVSYPGTVESVNFRGAPTGCQMKAVAIRQSNADTAVCADFGHARLDDRHRARVRKTPHRDAVKQLKVLGILSCVVIR